MKLKPSQTIPRATAVLTMVPGIPKANLLMKLLSSKGLVRNEKILKRMKKAMMPSIAAMIFPEISGASAQYSRSLLRPCSDPQ